MSGTSSLLGSSMAPTTGDKYTNPLDKLVNGKESELRKDVDALFPTPTATNETADGFDQPPSKLTPAQFERWPSFYQTQYLAKQTVPPPGSIQIGSGASTIHVILSSDKTKAFILEQLTKADVSKMSQPDQKLLAASDFFKTTLSIRLGLSADPMGVGERAKMYALITGADWSFEGRMTAELRDIYYDQAKAIADKCSQQAIFSPSDVQTAISAVLNRYNAAKVYGKWSPRSKDPAKHTDSILYKDVISSDNGAGIQAIFDSMIDNEKAILENNKQGDEIADQGMVGNKRLDAPNLIAAFQLQQQTIGSAINMTNTQLVNGVNNLLKDYAVMQRIIQKALQGFEATAKASDVRVIGVDGDAGKFDPGKGPDDRPHSSDFTLSDEELRVYCMFTTGLTPVSQRNPAEVLNNVTRPSWGMLTPVFKTGRSQLGGYTKEQLNSLATQLSSAVTQLQSKSQQDMDTINNLQQKITQHFTAANTALQNAQTLMQTIAQGFV